MLFYILKKRRYRINKRRKLRKRKNHADYLTYKEVARNLVLEKITHFNSFYSFSVGRISIKNQKTRWGSCSRKGNLNFNYKIALLPPDLVDYIIVHELCHLKEFNHSPAFWRLVGKTIPQHRSLRSQLKKIPL